MPTYRFLPGLALGLFCLTSPVSGILIETGGARVGGFLVSDDGKKLTIRTRTPDGQEKVVEYSHARVKVLSQIDSKRLETLTRDNPKGYRDLAQELAAMEGDPEARYMAMRLYLIAAHLDTKNLGPASLIAMSALAETPAEARRCRALAYLLDPGADAGLLKVEAVKPAQVNKAQAAALQDFIRSLQHYRTGKPKAATEIARRSGMDAIFGMAPGKMDQKGFLQWCDDANCTTCKAKGKLLCTTCRGQGVVTGMFGGLERCGTCSGKKFQACTACDGAGVTHPLPEEVVRAVLRAELWAMDQLTGGDGMAKKAQQPTTWSGVIQARQVGPVVPLTLETITDFDPRKCHYRNGAWVAP